MTTHRYNLDAIDRAFTHHAQAEGAPGSFDYRRNRSKPSTFVVVVAGEYLTLKPREAWVLALGLAAGRAIGKKDDE